VDQSVGVIAVMIPPIHPIQSQGSSTGLRE
jgi:hypothetical protein